jgi:anti-sigma B factor antagonist
MSEDRCPEEWLGHQVVVTLPEQFDRFTADRVREQLLLVINRGAAVLIADLAATISCDYSGADALARVYQRAVASGTELELVVVSGVVRRVLGLCGLDRLVSIYPTLEAAVAGADRAQPPGRPTTAAATPAAPRPADPLGAAVQRADHAEDLLDWAVSNIFNVGMTLHAAIDQPSDRTARRIADALGRLDDIVREIRHHMFGQHDQQMQRDAAWRPPPDLDERFERTTNCAALLHQRVVQTAHALHTAAADTAALLEKRGNLLGHPGHIDYPTESKQWRIIADQAAEMAERWEKWP